MNLTCLSNCNILQSLLLLHVFKIWWKCWKKNHWVWWLDYNLNLLPPCNKNQKNKRQLCDVLTSDTWIDPSCDAVFAITGEAYIRLNKLTEAEFWYRESLRAKPDHIPAHLTYGKLLAMTVTLFLFWSSLICVSIQFAIIRPSECSD